MKLAQAATVILIFIITCHRAQAARVGPSNIRRDGEDPHAQQLGGVGVVGGGTAEIRRQQYLYPMLIYGANNRVTGFKETLALGELLNRTVIAHDIGILPYEAGHRGWLKQKKGALFMDFKLLFDYDYLASRRSVVMLDDRLAAGWDGRLDAVIFFGDERELKYYHTFVAPSARVSTNKVKVLNYGAKRVSCDEQGIANLSSLIEPFNTVGLIIFDHVSAKAGFGLVPGSAHDDICSAAYLKASSDLTKSYMIRSIAKVFRQRHIGSERYVAVHIRPHPDKCLELWRSHPAAADLSTKELNKDCNNPSLFRIFVNQTLDAIRLYNLSSSPFVMCHPGIRNIVSQLYDAAGLKPFFYDEDVLGHVFGVSGPALLGMVEQEICTQADVFIGTPDSTMSGIVVESRSVADHSSQQQQHLLATTLYFSGDRP